MKVHALILITLLGTMLNIAAAAEPPLSNLEKTSAAHLTRLRSVRLWWNEQNRIIGASFKGIDANDRSLGLVGNLPLLESLVIVSLPQNSLTNNSLAMLQRLPNLTLLSISGSSINDEGLVHLRHAQNLEAGLVLNGPFTDRGLQYLEGMNKLKMLDLTQDPITDQGLQIVATLPALETLILNGTPITNDGIAILAQMKGLQDLYLMDCDIDDGAIPYLKQLTSLKTLVITNTKISAAGALDAATAVSDEGEVLHQSNPKSIPGTRRGADDYQARDSRPIRAAAR